MALAKKIMIVGAAAIAALSLLDDRQAVKALKLTMQPNMRGLPENFGKIFQDKMRQIQNSTQSDSHKAISFRAEEKNLREMERFHRVDLGERRAFCLRFAQASEQKARKVAQQKIAQQQQQRRQQAASGIDISQALKINAMQDPQYRALQQLKDHVDVDMFRDFGFVKQHDPAGKLQDNNGRYNLLQESDWLKAKPPVFRRPAPTDPLAHMRAQPMTREQIALQKQAANEQRKWTEQINRGLNIHAKQHPQYKYETELRKLKNEVQEEVENDMNLFRQYCPNGQFVDQFGQRYNTFSISPF